MYNQSKGFIIPALFLGTALVMLAAIGYVSYKFYQGLSDIEEQKTGSEGSMAK